MKWTRSNSIRLSKICIWLFAAAGVVCTLGLPSVLGGIVSRRGLESGYGRMCFLLSFYTLLLPAVTALVCLYRLLSNISQDEIFVRSNVQNLRRISWACYLAAFISLVSVSYYRPFVVLAAAAGFMGLILRVVKNVFAEAVAIKEENDFTI